VAVLLAEAREVWTERPYVGPRPHLKALEAIAAFARRIPPGAVDDLLAISEPALTNDIVGSKEVVEVLLESYVAVEGRRSDIAAALGRIMNQDEPTPYIWPRVAGIPQEARAELLPYLESAIASGNSEAIEIASQWHLPIGEIQIRARQGAAALLRRAIGATQSQATRAEPESHAVDLLIALAKTDSDQLVSVDKTLLAPDRARLTGRVALRSIVETAADKADAAAAASTQAVSEDQIIELASGPVPELLSAVANKLIQIAESAAEAASDRRGIIDAIGRLLDVIDPSALGGIPQRLAAIFREPGQSLIDATLKAMDKPLGIPLIPMGGERGCPGLRGI
jgi:hypothetical protein